MGICQGGNPIVRCKAYDLRHSAGWRLRLPSLLPTLFTPQIGNTTPDIQSNFRRYLGLCFGPWYACQSIRQPFRYRPTQEFFHRDAVAADQKRALCFERCRECRRAGMGLRRAAALHFMAVSANGLSRRSRLPGPDPANSRAHTRRRLPRSPDGRRPRTQSVCREIPDPNAPRSG